MKIGIFGGTFDPPHMGHVIAVKQSKKLLGLDKVLVIPTATPPHKQVESGASSEQRLALTKKAFKKLKYVEVLPLEIEREGISYTADTLAELREIYPNASFYLLVGYDMFMSLQSWYNPEDIFASCIIVGLGREQGQTNDMQAHGAFLFERYGATYDVLQNPVIPISSSELRAKLARGETSEFLQPEVLVQIREFGLYNK